MICSYWRHIIYRDGHLVSVHSFLTMYYYAYFLDSNIHQTSSSSKLHAWYPSESKQNCLCVWIWRSILNLDWRAFNATCNNISVWLWWSVLLVRETHRKSSTCHKSLMNIYHIGMYQVHINTEVKFIIRDRLKSKSPTTCNYRWCTGKTYPQTLCH